MNDSKVKEIADLHESKTNLEKDLEKLNRDHDIRIQYYYNGVGWIGLSKHYKDGSIFKKLIVKQIREELDTIKEKIKSL